jgi:hypothetical protein
VFTGDFVFVDLAQPDLADPRPSGRAALVEPRVCQAHLARGALVLPRTSPSASAGPIARSAPRSASCLRSAALAIGDRGAFLAWAGKPATFPESYRVIKAVNVGLRDVDEREADELDLGRNECAMSRPQA